MSIVRPAPIAGQRRRHRPGAGLVLDPDQPTPIAEAFLKRLYQLDGLTTLCYQNTDFYSYARDLGHYRKVEVDAIRADLHRFLKTAERDDPQRDRLVPFQPNLSVLANVLDAIKLECHTPEPAPCWLDDSGPEGVDPRELLATPTEILHVPTRAMLTSTPAFFTTHGLPFRFDEDAPPPEHWLKFLHSLWPADRESRETLQEIVGYLLLSITNQQKAFMLVGPPRSGKGTIGRMIRRLVGEANTCAPTLASLSTPFGLQNLIGKTVALVADARISGRHDTAVISERLLSITGEDAQSIPRKYKGDWNGTLAVRFFIMTNELPAIVDQSGAFASRFIVLALTKSWLDREDHGLDSRLAGELPGILLWALAGLDRLMERGHFLQPKSADQMIQQLNDLGSPVGAFLRERCIVGPGLQAPQWKVFAAWRAWCEVSGRDHPSTIQQLAKNLMAALPGLKVTHPRIEGKPVRHWQGLGLKPAPVARFGGRD